MFWNYASTLSALLYLHLLWFSGTETVFSPVLTAWSSDSDVIKKISVSYSIHCIWGSSISVQTVVLSLWEWCLPRCTGPCRVLYRISTPPTRGLREVIRSVGVTASDCTEEKALWWKAPRKQMAGCPILWWGRYEYEPSRAVGGTRGLPVYF